MDGHERPWDLLSYRTKHSEGGTSFAFAAKAIYTESQIPCNCVQPIRFGRITVRSMRFQTIRSNSTVTLFHECAFVKSPICLNPVPAELVNENEKYSATIPLASTRLELPTVDYTRSAASN